MIFLNQLILFGLPGILLLFIWRRWAKHSDLSPLKMGATAGVYVFITMTLGSFLFLGTEFTDAPSAIWRGLIFGIPAGVILYIGGRRIREERERREQ